MRSPSLTAYLLAIILLALIYAGYVFVFGNLGLVGAVGYPAFREIVLIRILYEDNDKL